MTTMTSETETVGAGQPAGGHGRRPLRRSDDLLSAHAAAGAILGFSATLLWAVTGDGGHFWPRWLWFAVAVLFSLHWVIWRSSRKAAAYMNREQTPGSTLDVVLIYKIPLMVWAAAVIGAVWAMTGFGELWPRWAWFGIAFVTGVELAGRELIRRWNREAREAELTERVGELTRTRRGALEAQAEELRRVERDLHDGAQSRLVALSVRLARAEERLADRPQTAELVREAREEATAAIAELRDLARGIAPPVLADRGLEAAARSLAARAGGPVDVEARLPRRPDAVTENAAYFVVAEALTNAAKHAPGAPVSVVLELDRGRLRIKVDDRGPGGADPDGGGLRGLRHRVEALDGRLGVASPPGEGTRIEVELPCES